MIGDSQAHGAILPTRKRIKFRALGWESMWWLPVGTAVLIPRAARFWEGWPLAQGRPFSGPELGRAPYPRRHG